MTDEIPEIVDRSRVDAYAATRRRTMFMHSLWRPMLAGAVGAALMMGCVWIVLPKVSYREVIVPAITMKETEVPKVTMRDVTVPNISMKPVEVPSIAMKPVEIPNIELKPHDVPFDRFVPRDVPFDRFVPHEVPFEIAVPRIVEAAPASPLAATPVEPQALAGMGTSTGVETLTAAPRSPEERAFVGTGEWRDAVVRGRIARADKNGFVVATDTGEEFGFWPARLNAVGKLELNPSQKDQVEGLLDDLVRCNRQPNRTYRCFALHDGREVLVPQKPIGRPT